MKTIRVIDLLNKIANGEEVPTFRYEGNRYLYSKATEMFDDLDNDERCKSEIYLSELNDEIEIIEDTPKEDISNLKWGEYVIKEDVKKCSEEDLRTYISLIMETQNKIIEKVNGEDNDSK